MLAYFCLSLGVLPIFHCVYILRSLKASKDWIDADRRLGPPNESCLPHFVLVVPALREQAVILDTIRHLEQLRYPNKNYSIIVACDAKESGLGETPAIVRSYIERRGQIEPGVGLVEYDGPGRSRAYQVEAAFQHIVNKRQNAEGRARTFVGFYDADSRPESESLNDIVRAARMTRGAKTFQQLICYLENQTHLQRCAFFEANAILQTMWCYTFELPLFLRTMRELSSGQTASFPPYGLGHGLFVDLTLLQAMGGIQTEGVCDGMQLGFKSVGMREPIVPVVARDLCQSPTSLVTLFHQHALWAAGNCEVLARRQTLLGQSASITAVVNHILLLTRWMLLPLGYVAYIVLVGYVFGIIFALVFVGLIILFNERISIWVSHLGNPEINRARLSSRMLIPVAAVYKALGPYWGVTKRLFTRWHFRKVER